MDQKTIVMYHFNAETWHPWNVQSLWCKEDTNQSSASKGSSIIYATHNHFSTTITLFELLMQSWFSWLQLVWSNHWGVHDQSHRRFFLLVSKAEGTQWITLHSFWNNQQQCCGDDMCLKGTTNQLYFVILLPINILI